MSTVVTFFRPTKTKLIFLIEWVLFILITAVRGELETPHQVLVAGYPLIFFYLIACMLTALSQHIEQIARSRRLLIFAGGLMLLDQLIKAIVTAFIPYQATIPIIPNGLHLAHKRNFHGSWIASVFNVQPANIFNLIQWGQAISVLLFSTLCHRYYTTTHRKSLWADVVLLGIFAGYASWIWDMALRGYIVDFINLPGLVTADLKDIFPEIGVAAFFAETVDNPQVSWRWRGWREERDDLIHLAKSLGRFSIQELHKLQQAVVCRFRKGSRPE
ncbi:MAG: signal peptidase II [Anaerolineae bacterium]|nr:signal peptidase II [Anaerolineae bacterium]